VPATIRPLDADARRPRRWTVETDESVWAAAPGQACAFYDGDVCLGGGRIAVPTAASPSVVPDRALAAVG
jgi:tRNA U34 2-thiouridine synthase MnmA/TrmU